MTLRRKVIPVEFQIKPFVRQMKSPRPPRMAGRRAAILLIRLVAPALRSAALSLLARRPLRAFGWSTLSIDALLFVSSSHVIPNHTFPCLRGAFARPAPVPFSAASHAPLIFLLLRRFAAPPVFSCPAPSPRGGRSAERRTQKPVAPAKRDHRVSETRAVPGDGTAPVGAPPWRFTDRATTRHVSDSASDHAAPSRGRPQGQPFGSRGLPAAVAPRFRDATPPLRLRTPPETPLTSEDGADIALMHYVVKIVFICSHEVVM
jgi:hypothetical protein